MGRARLERQAGLPAAEQRLGVLRHALQHAAAVLGGVLRAAQAQQAGRPAVASHPHSCVLIYWRGWQSRVPGNAVSERGSPLLLHAAFPACSGYCTAEPTACTYACALQSCSSEVGEPSGYGLKCLAS